VNAKLVELGRAECLKGLGVLVVEKTRIIQASFFH
jgi:hypothetical protein